MPDFFVALSEDLTAESAKTMDKIKELLAKRQAALDAGEVIRDAAKAAGEDLTDEQLTKIEEHVATAANCQEQVIEAEARIAKRNAALGALDDAAEWSKAARKQQTTPVDPSDGTRPPPKKHGSTSTHEHTFPSFGHQLVAIVQAATQHPSEWDPRLGGPHGAATGANESVASEGGFLVGADESQALLQRMYDSNQIVNGGAGYSGPMRIPISANSNSVKFKALDEKSRANGSRWGGIEASWIEEAGTKPDTKPKFREMELSRRLYLNAFRELSM